jgi:hypothetical protein
MALDEKVKVMLIIYCHETNERTAELLAVIYMRRKNIEEKYTRIYFSKTSPACNELTVL